MIELDKKNNADSNKVVKIIITVAILVITALGLAIYLGVSSFISFKQAEKAAQDNLITKSELAISQAAEAVTKSADKYEEDLLAIIENQDIQKLLEANNEKAVESIVKAFKDYKDANAAVQNIYFGAKDKKMYLYPELELPEDYDPTSRIWYTNAIETKKFTWSEPYIDALSNAAIISLSVPVYKDNELLGVMSVDLKFDSMIQEIKDTKLGSGGYIYITDQNGTIIMHPDKEKVGMPSENGALRKLIDEGNTGIIRYSYQGEEQLAIYSHISKLRLNIIGHVKE